jgi:aspartyl protease family protein
MRCGREIGLVHAFRRCLAVLALAAGVLIPSYLTRRDVHPGASSAPAALAARPTALVANAAASSRAMIVPRDARGHFLVEARVDGRLINFMVDTGASVIALTASDAARLGIRPAQRDFTVEVRTANGSVRAAPARLDMVEVGDLTVRDVVAVVMPDGALSDNLLGLSFLSRLRRFEYSDGRLVLEQ